MNELSMTSYTVFLFFFWLSRYFGRTCHSFRFLAGVAGSCKTVVANIATKSHKLINDGNFKTTLYYPLRN